MFSFPGFCNRCIEGSIAALFAGTDASLSVLPTESVKRNFFGCKYIRMVVNNLPCTCFFLVDVRDSLFNAGLLSSKLGLLRLTARM
jgi:hypothetical protein